MQAGGSGIGLAKTAAEQQAKLQKEKEEMTSAIETAIPVKGAVASGDSSTTASGSGIGFVYKGGAAFGSECGLELNASSEIGRKGTGGLLVNCCSYTLRM